MWFREQRDVTDKGHVLGTKAAWLGALNRNHGTARYDTARHAGMAPRKGAHNPTWTWRRGSRMPREMVGAAWPYEVHLAAKNRLGFSATATDFQIET